jgi:heme-degrading monooxygenase HmoA|tara:strand:+ start:1297 stop:2412 length:1116 start_codon:yes stop_codon:yes gene_type:complete
MSSAISFATSVRGCPVVGRRAHVARRVAPVVTRCNADIMSEVGSLRLTENQLQASRYVASNRFKLQKNKGPTFEKRWAERKSRLANLDGFRFFTLMRRVEASAGGMGGPPTAATSDDEYDYVSLTIWEDKSGFDAWRTGEAFKEAHGGGTVFGFAEMLISSLFVLKGNPKPAFYDGLLPVVKPPADDTPWQAVGGWRDVPADGVNPLNTDVFVAMNRFKVLPGKEAAFEMRWRARESRLTEMDGFLTFLLLRRDALKAEGTCLHFPNPTTVCRLSRVITHTHYGILTLSFSQSQTGTTTLPSRFGTAAARSTIGEPQAQTRTRVKKKKPRKPSPCSTDRRRRCCTRGCWRCFRVKERKARKERESAVEVVQ